MHAAWANSPVETASGSKFRLLSTLVMIGAQQTNIWCWICLCMYPPGGLEPLKRPNEAPPQPKIRVPSLITDIDHCPPSSVRKLRSDRASMSNRAVGNHRQVMRWWGVVRCNLQWKLRALLGERPAGWGMLDEGHHMKAEPFFGLPFCSGILSLGMECCEQVSQSSRCVHRYRYLAVGTIY
jgi:hypothetical protein